MEDGRRSRDETTIQIRKARKQEQLDKRRRGPVAGASNSGVSTASGAIPPPMIVSSSSSSSSSNDDDSHEGNGGIHDDRVRSCPSVRSKELVRTYTRWETNPVSVSFTELYETTMQFRRMLTTEEPPTRAVVESGAVTHMVNMLGVGATLSDGGLAFEAAWALTNVASTEYAGYVVDCNSNAVPNLTALLRYGAPNVREQVGWCLGNIAGDSSNLRDLLLQYPGVVDGM